MGFHLQSYLEAQLDLGKAPGDSTTKLIACSREIECLWPPNPMNYSRELTSATDTDWKAGFRREFDTKVKLTREEFTALDYWKCMTLPTFLQNCKNVPMHTFNYSFHPRGCKTPTSFVPFHTNYDYKSRLLINLDILLRSSLHNTMLWTRKAFTIVHDL